MFRIFLNVRKNGKLENRQHGEWGRLDQTDRLSSFYEGCSFPVIAVDQGRGKVKQQEEEVGLAEAQM